MADLNKPNNPDEKEPTIWPEIKEQPAAPYFMGESVLPISGTKVKEEENNTKKKVFVDDDPEHHNGDSE